MNVIKYIEESYDELVHKVTWPTWSELQSTSIIVLVASVLFALSIFVMDFVFGINANAEGAEATWKGILGYYYNGL
jgi:preprotein translocase subunit SecE